MIQISHSKYFELLEDMSKCEDITSSKAQKALNLILATRQFEIEMYWKRTTYFWTLIAAIFAGYMAVQSIKSDQLASFDRQFYSVVISIIGLIFSLGWCLANKGSKYWHENWENHAGLLCEKIMGPIFNVTLERPEPKGFFNSLAAIFVNPGRFSVTKINSWLSWFILIVWIILLFSTIQTPICHCQYINKFTAMFAAGIVFSLLILFSGKSWSKDYRHVAMMRKAKILDPESSNE